MNSDWDNVTLGDVLTLQRGIDLPVQDRKFGSTPVVASTGVVGFHCEAPVKGPGVVIGRSGSIGGGQYIESDFWPLNTTLWVKDFKGNSARFCYYLLKSMDFSRLNAGSGVPTLNRNHLHPLPVLKPSLKEQENIADTLGALDDRITLLRETNKTLEAIAQAIFKSWFVDFDPVRAKMEGRAPAGMDAETAAFFPDELVETELGLVPRGWEIKTVGDAIETVGGATPDTKNEEYWEPAEYCWTSPKDLSGLPDPVLLKTERSISAKGLAKISSGLLPVASLLMSSRAPIGYLAITDVPVAINQGYIGMPSGGYLSPLYMLNWCKLNMECIKGRANGSTFMEISKKAFRPIPIILPPKNLLNNFEEVCGALFNKLLTNAKQAQTLTELRDTLLPRLISGKLRLSDAVVEPS